MTPANPNDKLSPRMLATMTSKHTNKRKTSIEASSDNSGKPKVKIVGSVIDSTTINPPNNMKIHADSGATIYCLFNKRAFTNVSLDHCEERTIIIAYETSCKSSLMEEVVIETASGIFRLQKALCAPNRGYNLVSTGRLANNGIESTFRRNGFTLQL